ncbi:hypothetical protein GCM10025873_07540 [Demequina sediminis]|uniref:hypothetical protein n=1 Tax=Demequina sediminis TaxID=1930058 RepID=UPI00257338FB|nr:hypothetical protein [Demequina sediminis]BDZ60963.1 hypothetical protein GCM10025873_07540 [Demequina sediminis]
MIVLVFGIFLVVVAAAYFLVVAIRSSAEDELQAENDRRTQLQTELATYGYINTLADTFDNSVKAREWAGSTDIDWATHLTALLSSAPDGITFTDMAMAQGTPAGVIATDGTAFAQPDMGSIVFTGRASTPDLTAALIEAFDALPGFSDTWVEAKQLQGNNENGAVFWQYSGATRITFSALSGRTVTEQTTVPEELLAEIEASEAVPSASPAPTGEGAN